MLWFMDKPWQNKIKSYYLEKIYTSVQIFIDILFLINKKLNLRNWKAFYTLLLSFKIQITY